jgi:hypothetical protein
VEDTYQHIYVLERNVFEVKEGFAAEDRAEIHRDHQQETMQVIYYVFILINEKIKYIADHLILLIIKL